MITMIREALQGLIQLLYPENCEACNNWLAEGEAVLCLHCSTLLPRTGFHHIPDNPAMEKFTGRVPLQYATSFTYFSGEGMMQHLIHRLKYKERPEIGRHLGQLLGQELLDNTCLKSIDAIIPVPLHRAKERKRGFNQSAMIAEGIGKIWSVPVWTDALVRRINNESQTNKTRIERIENVQGVFELKDKERVRGRHILLVDDVLTTGATLESAANKLLEAGNVSISIATIALAID